MISENVKSILESSGKKIYFIGIGGVSISGLAEILYKKGFVVTGSDRQTSFATDRLLSLGININFTQVEENITDDIDLVVYTSAVSYETNQELKKAIDTGILNINRAELLGFIMKDYSNSFCIAGTNGKTTTTSMLAHLLINSEFDPTVSVGANLELIKGTLKIGKSDIFIMEACEYKDNFHNFNPNMGIILNVEKDHGDYFTSIYQVYESFNKFAKNIDKDGVLIVNKNINNDVDGFNMVTKNIECKIETFGTDDSDWVASNISYDKNGFSSYNLSFKGKDLGKFNLKVLGDCNIYNSISAIIGAYHLGLSIDKIKELLPSFVTPKRRFEFKGEKNGVKIFDDYAHIPTSINEVSTTLSRIEHNKLVGVFQPHTYSRTIDLFDNFKNGFKGFDEILFVDIYAAREIDKGEINSKILSDAVASNGVNARYCNDFNEAVLYLKKICTSGDILVTIGAGDVYKIGEDFLE